jgi:tol-pal system protein YbgF
MKNVAVLMLLMFFASLAGCVANDNLQARVNQNEQAIRQLNMQVSGVQPAQADTWSQVQTLRQEMAAMKGSMDDLNIASSNMGGLSELVQMVQRHEAALRLIESQLALNLNLGARQQTNPDMPLTAPAVAQAPDTQTVAATPQDTTDMAKALYDAGYKAFTERRYADAVKSFTDFTVNYSKHNLIGNAWFWRGESYYQQNDFAAAALDYEQVISKYPANQKAPSAYLKQSMCFIKVDKQAVAKTRLNELIKKFPKSPEATRAQQLLKELG